MRWFGGFVLIAVLWVGAADSVEISEDNWKTYRNEKYGYEFAYPPGMEYAEYAGRSSGDLKDADTGVRLVAFEVWPPGECPGQPEGTTAGEIGITRAKTVTHSDGPDGSSYCGDPLKARTFSSSQGVDLFELELTCKREIYQAEDEESEIIIEGKKGPIYFANISQSWRKRILLADPVNSRRLSQAAPENKLDDSIVRRILDSLKTFAVPKPEGICIEDLAGI